MQTVSISSLPSATGTSTVFVGAAADASRLVVPRKAPARLTHTLPLEVPLHDVLTPRAAQRIVRYIDASAPAATAFWQARISSGRVYKRPYSFKNIE